MIGHRCLWGHVVKSHFFLCGQSFTCLREFFSDQKFRFFHVNTFNFMYKLQGKPRWKSENWNYELVVHSIWIQLCLPNKSNAIFSAAFDLSDVKEHSFERRQKCASSCAISTHNGACIGVAWPFSWIRQICPNCAWNSNFPPKITRLKPDLGGSIEPLVERISWKRGPDPWNTHWDNRNEPSLAAVRIRRPDGKRWHHALHF